MATKQHKNKIKAKQAKKHKSVNKLRHKSRSASDSLKHNVWTAIFTILSLIVVHATQIFHLDYADPVNAYLHSQASAGSFYVNILAVLSVAYGKATGNFHVNGQTYLLSMLGCVLVAHIFAQAVFMVYPNVKLYAEFMRSEWFSIIGHIVFWGIIVAISCTKGVPAFTKETIKHKTI